MNLKKDGDKMKIKDKNYFEKIGLELVTPEDFSKKKAEELEPDLQKKIEDLKQELKKKIILRVILIPFPILF